MHNQNCVRANSSMAVPSTPSPMLGLGLFVCEEQEPGSQLTSPSLFFNMRLQALDEILDC